MAQGKLGSADLSADVDTLIYTAPANKTATVNIRVANRGARPAAVRVALGSGSAPAAADYIDYDVVVPANGIMEDTGVVCSAGEKIWVRSDVESVSVRIHGFEGAV